VDLASIHGLKLFLIRDAQGHWSLRQLLKAGPQQGKKHSSLTAASIAFPATRLVLDDSTVVFNDERRDFQSTVEDLEGTLDARAFPLLAFSLNGRTEDQSRDNLSMTGEWNADEGSLYARADLVQVPLKRYFNYVLPPGGLQFEDGQASLSVRVRQQDMESDLDFAGRADVDSGQLRIPGIREPLEHFHGAVDFNRSRLKMDSVHADFLGSTWLASGELDDLKAPVLHLSLANPGVPLSALSQQIKGLSALALSGTASLAVTVTGGVRDPVALGVLEAPQLQVAGIDLSQVQAMIQINRSGLELPSLKATLWEGSLSGKARIVFPNKKKNEAGSLSADVKADALQLKDWSYKDKNYLPVTGTASAKATLSGALKSPDLEASLDCPHAYLGDQALGPLAATARLHAKKMEISLQTWKGHLQGTLALALEKPAHFGESSFHVSGFPLPELSMALASCADSVLTPPGLHAIANQRLSHLRGNLDADVSFRGAFRQPSLDAQITGRDLKFLLPEGFWQQADDGGIPLQAQGGLHLDQGQVLFGEPGHPFNLGWGTKKAAKMTLSGPLPLATRIGARKDGLKINLSADLGALEAFEVFKHASGHADMDLRLGGTRDSLNADGWLQVKGFNAKMETAFDSIKNGEAQVWVKDKSVVVENLSFDSGGSAAMTGNLDFSSGIHPEGNLEVHTDDKGIKLDDFIGRLDGYVVMDPMNIAFSGLQGSQLQGKIRLHDMVFKVVPKAPAQDGTAASPAQASQPSAPLGLDLRVEIDDNVWLKKLEEQLDVLDPATLLNKLISSVEENYLHPSFEFRLSPTESDFLVQGGTKDLHLTGRLGIDRGTLHFQENNFNIDQDRTRAQVVFAGGKRGDVTADASTQIRYAVSNSLTGRQDVKSVQVTLQVRPLSEEALEQAGLEEALLNYSLDFVSDPPMGASPEQQRESIMGLLVTGQPTYTDAGQVALAGETQNFDASQAGTDQVNRLLSGTTRKAISTFAGSLRRLLEKYLNITGGDLVDYFQVSPKLSYQSGATAPISSAGGGGAISKQIQQQTFSANWLFEMGKSLTNNIFVTGQCLVLNDDAVQAVKNQNLYNSNDVEVRNYGLRAALEYRLSQTRLFEFSYSYSVDENLEPIAFEPGQLNEAHRIYVGLRNSLPTDSYTPRMARERREHALEMKEAAQ
jgi:hypothetical protein